MTLGGAVRLAALLVVMTSALIAAGCAALGVAAYKLAPSPVVDAKYVPATRPTVVYVHRAANPADASIEAQRIGQMVAADLAKHKIGPMLDTPPVGALGQRRAGGSVWASATPAGRTGSAGTRPTTQPQAVTNIAELGRSVGAKQVIYVDLVQFQVEEALASEMTRGTAEAHVYVIDSETGQPLWPADFGQGYAVAVGSPYARIGQKVSESQVRDHLCRDMAMQISRLFYKYKPEEVEAEDAAAGQ